MSSFPNVISAIDCTHVAIRALSENDFAFIKARVCNAVQKHILLYWVKWSCYPESSQYIMYSEKGTKIIRPLWQLQD